MEKIIDQIFADSILVKQQTLEKNRATIVKAAKLMTKALNDKKKILFCGNGGSAADSQHLAAEFIGRFQKERRALPAIALTTDTSIITALANDYAFEKIFARQVEGLGQKGDVLVGISTSGNSINVIQAVLQAKEMGLVTISLTGGDGGKLGKLTDISLVAPSKITARVQESHLCIAHCLCEIIEKDF